MSSMYVMGMNIGSSENDYRFLHYQALGKESLSELERQLSAPASSLSAAAAADLSAAAAPIPSGAPRDPLLMTKIFDILENQNAADYADIVFNSPSLTHLILYQGLDIIEKNMDAPAARSRADLKFGKEFIRLNSPEILKIMRERIRDYKGGKQFESQFPYLTRHLQETYGYVLPKQAWYKRLINSITHLFKKGIPAPTLPPQGHSLVKDQLLSIRNRLAANFFNKVVSMDERPSAIMLQEVLKTNPDALKILKDGGYDIIRNAENSYTAIAIDRYRFLHDGAEKVEGIDGSNEFTAVFAMDKETHEKYIFISAHIPGIDLVIPNDPTEINRYLTKVEAELAIANPAVIALKKLVAQLQEKRPGAKVVIQGDFNVNPEYFSDTRLSEKIKSMNLFAYLQGNDDGKPLDISRMGSPTELNRGEPPLEERELDYFFTSKDLAGHAKMAEPTDPELRLIGRNGDPLRFDPLRFDPMFLHFDPMLLFSDHRPIWMRIE